MNKGVLYSLTLHILLFLVIYFGLPNLRTNPPEELVISVDILPISEISNVKSKQEQKEETKVKEEKKSSKDVPNSVKKQEQTKEETKSSNIKHKTEENKKEDKPDLIIKEGPKPAEKPKPKEQKEEKSKDKTKEKEPSKEKKQDKAKEVSELDSLLKTLEKPQQKSSDEKKTKEDAKVNQEAQKKSQGKYNENIPLSISEKDTIGNQIYNSWYFQAGAKDSKDMFVILRIAVSLDGTVTQIEIVDMNKYNNGSTYYKTFVDSAIRAVKKASPFTNLSVERYNAWKELELNFDPRGVVF
ncbi:MAG: hypothetical protein ACK4OM_00350 [Alphaproteobacteria bacterium]